MFDQLTGVSGFFTPIKKALIRRPARSFINAISQELRVDRPCFEHAIVEWEAYSQALKKMDVDVEVCEAIEDFPDGNFVEDTYLILDELMIELNPGAASRSKEPLTLRDKLPTSLKRFEISKQFTIDGGDILRDRKNLYIGSSKRTSELAINELKKIVSFYGYNVIIIPVVYSLHLKSGMTGILPHHFVIHKAYKDFLEMLKRDNPLIKYFIVPDEEIFAANVMPVNGKILIPKGCPKTKAYIEKFYQLENILEVDTSQVRLVDGALTCSSLLF